MTQQKQSTKAQFIKLQNFLGTQTKTEVTVYYLQQLINFFKDADLNNEKVMKNDVYDELRDTVKSIFTYLDKVRMPNTNLLKLIQKLIKELLIAICAFCSAYYCKYHPLGCGDMIKDFLSSECRLFVPEYAAAAPSISTLPDQEQKEEAPEAEEIIEIEQRDWIWTKESTFKTLFFCDCIEVIMRNLCNFEDKFEEMNIMVIGQFLRLLYYMDDYIIQDKLIDLCVKYADKIEEIFKSPSKEIMKEANKQKLQEVSQYMTKLLRYYKNDALKKRIQLLGPLLGMTMMKMNSIEKKMVGCKIVSKFSYEMLYRSTSYITQTSYSEWVVSQKFFELIFQDQNQASLIKSSQDTFKLLVKRGKLSNEQFHKFFQILEKAEPELRRAMFKLIDPFRVDYNQIQSMIEIFRTSRGTQFYDDQFFYFVEGLSRYSTETQLTHMLSIVETIIKEHYNKLQSYLTKRRSVQCYAYVFDRLVNYKDAGQRIEAYSKVASDFIEEPNQNKLIMLRTLFDNLSEHKMERASQQILCDKIIIELKFIENTLKYASDVKFKDDLITTIKMILKKYGYSFNKQPFNQQTLLQCVQFPEIFEQILKLTKSNGTEELQKLFSDLSNLTAIKSFDFSCIKSVFIKMNSKGLKTIKKQYAQGIITNATICDPGQFMGLDTLKYLIFNSEKTAVRHGACQLLVEVYTNFTDDFRQEGEIYLIQFMKAIIKLLQHKLKQFENGNESKISMIGTLELIEDLMLNTEYFGVGSLKAHNSLIPTSTVNLKVYNNCTMGDDVLKIFEKKFPSNKTLYEVIVEVSKQFKVGPLDMCFEYPNNIMIKYNGLTLEELKLNGQEVNAIKAPQSRLKKEPLTIDGKLTPKSKKAFADMFKRYAPNGKMAAKQCSDYIEGVTLSFCPLFDSRINSLFAEYDADKDGILTLEDFLKFYQDCVIDIEKLETVEKNLSNLRYRRDLKLYDDDFDSLNEQVLFRYHVWENKDIYEDLFKLLYCQNIQLSSLAQLLLLRLPTYPKVIESLNESFNFKQKNPFEVEYLLTALQSQIAHDQTFSKKLISANNHLAIFEYLKQLNSKQLKSINEKNCEIICFHLLRSLLFEGVKTQENQLVKEFPKLAFKLPETDLFLSVIKESIKINDSTLLDPTFLLQLTQEKMQFDWLEEAAFNNDKDIRVTTCAFLYTWMLKKTNGIDLFKVKIRETHNEEWFCLLTILVQVDAQINYSEIFSDKIKELQGLTQSLEGKRFNPIIHGNLKIIKQLHCRLNQDQKDELDKTLNNILPSLISNENRQIVYGMIAKENSLMLISTMDSIADVKIGKEAQPRNTFVGIRNLGCICYMNSILQQFFMIKQFHSLIMSLQPKEDETEINGVKVVDDFLYQMQQLYVYLELSQKQYYDPSTFCLAVKDFQGKPINTAIQEDAHEFLNTAFDKIERYTKDQQKLKILERIFGGKTVTEIICQTCKNKKEVVQDYYHLTLEVKGMKNIKESFDKWILAEQISDYFCQNCEKTVDKITKQTLIKEAPEVLVINLQRIIFDLETFLKVKVHTKLEFDQILDLHSYFSSSSEPAPYHLKGVVIHSGTSEGGHYYSLIKHQNKKWYKFNDQSVTFFNESNVGKEAFGGQEHYDTMVGDATSSTNAYILFYERDRLNQQCQIDELKPINIDRIRKQVLQDNQQFEHQLQLYQPSYFTCLDSLFEQHIKGQNKEVLLSFFEIYLKIIKHLCVNSDIKNNLINNIKENFLALCDAMPEKTATIIDLFDKKVFGEIICTNNDVNIREIYQKILIKSILTNLKDPAEKIPDKVEEVLDYLICLLDDSLILKNIYKSYQYFDMWKELICNEKIKLKMLKMDIFGKLIDLLMGNDSIFSTKDKKRAEFNMSEAMPLIPLITALVQHKSNLVNQHPDRENVEDFFESTDLESRIINNTHFYRKMMKNKLDMGLLAPIISLYAYKDEKYSMFVAQILLKALNNIDEIQDKNIVFANIKAFLKVEDELTLERMKWILGMPQLDSISFTEQVFGMMNSPESKVISYVSTLFFVKDEKYSPLLFSLFDKRKYYNAFSCYGICMLLQLLNQSTIARDYLVSLPAPTYIQKTYIDWIEVFTIKVKTEEHYGLPLDKNILSEKLSKLLEEYHQKVQQNSQYKDLPVNKKIIGKNSQVILKETLKTQNCQIDMWAHETYILDNRPFSIGNIQLPDEQFSFNSTSDTPKARCFLKSLDLQSSMEEEAPDIGKEWTVLTFNIKSSVNIVIKLTLDKFRHKIYLKSGDHSVNCPYAEGDIASLLELEEMIEQKKEEESLTVAASSQHSSYLPEIMEEQKMMEFDNMGYGMMQVNCKTCTYLNVGRDTCEMCGTDLK